MRTLRSLCVALVVMGTMASCGKKAATTPSPTGTASFAPRHPDGQGTGDIVVTETDKGMKFTGTLTGLKAGDYVLHLHVPRGCPPPQEGDDAENHRAEIGKITADASGSAKVDLVLGGRVMFGTDPEKQTSGWCVVLQPTTPTGYLSSATVSTPGWGLGPK